jgi:ATP-dependent helicase/nuclease subunit A
MMLQDQSARDIARDNHTTTLLVEAGAGTGKTTTMVGRIISLLSSSKVDIREIVAITFSDRAAQELKDRLRAGLFGELADAKGEKADRLSRALSHLEGAPIGTIHSFCGGILRQYPIDAGVDVQFGTADNRQADDLEQAVWESWFSAELSNPEHAELLRRAMAVGLSSDKMKSLAHLVLNHRGKDLAALFDGVRSHMERWDGEIARLREDIALAHACDPSVGMNGKKLAPGQVRNLAVVDAFLPLLDGAGSIDERLELLFGSVPKVTLKVGNIFNPAIAKLRGLLVDEITAGMLRWLCDPADGYCVAYEKAKETQGLVDFQDLLNRTRDLVRDNITVRRELQRQYRFIIVDEFQDTDPVQTELIVYLAQSADDRDDAEWTDVRLTPGTLCVVGDPKQSIYRFRGADIETYNRVAGMIRGADGSVCTLSTNFRSQKGIIDAVNAIFPPVFARESAEDDTAVAFQPPYEPLEPGPNAGDGDGGVRWLVPDDECTGNADEKRRVEADLVAGAIRQVVSEEWPIRGKDGESRGVRFGDVGILYRSGSSLWIYEQALRDHGIPYHVVGGKSFYRNEEITRVISVLTAIEQPGDAVHVVAALKSPFFGVRDEDLARFVVNHGGRFDYRTDPSADAPASIRDAFACLRDLHEIRTEQPPSVIVRTLFTETGVLAVYARSPYGEQAVANLMKIEDEARLLEADGPLSFRRFLNHLKRQGSGGGDEGEAFLDDESASAVRLLTIHKAKGLEFPVVIPIDTMAGSGGSPPSVRLLCMQTKRDEPPVVAAKFGKDVATSTWDSVELVDKARATAESIRLLYVALTRTRDYLLLPRPCEPPAGKMPTWLDHIAGAPGSESWQRFTPNTAPAVMDVPESPPDIADLHREREELVARREEITGRGRTPHIVYKRPSLHEQERGSTHEDDAPVGVELADNDSEQRRLLGTVVHGVLEKLRPGDESRVAAEVENLGPQVGLEESRFARAVSMVTKTLKSDLIVRAWDAERTWSEVPVMLYTDDGREKTITRGVCDLVFQDGDGLVLVDYKTDEITSEADIDEKVDHYRPQIATYVDALQVATGVTVVESWLLLLGSDGEAREERVR